MLCCFLYNCACLCVCVSTCVCTSMHVCMLFLHSSQLCMVLAFPDPSEALRSRQIQDLAAGTVPSQGLFFKKIIFLPKILKGGKTALYFQKQSVKQNAQRALLVATQRATYTFLLLNQGINLGLARHESRFLNNCLGDKSQKILHLLLCQYFCSAVLSGKTESSCWRLFLSLKTILCRPCGCWPAPERCVHRGVEALLLPWGTSSPHEPQLAISLSALAANHH